MGLIDSDASLKQARALDAGALRGPWHGLQETGNPVFNRIWTPTDTPCITQQSGI